MNPPTLFEADPLRLDTQTPGRRRPKVPAAARPNTPATTGLTVETPNPTTWTLAFPAPDRMMSVNTGKHWRVTSPVKKAWREAMFRYAQQAKLPTGLTRVRIDIELRFPTRGRDRDESNYHHYLGKPCVDAIGRARRYQIQKGKRAGEWVVEVGYGLIADDNPRKYLHCRDCPHLLVSDTVGPRPYGEVVVTITDLSGADDA